MQGMNRFFLAEVKITGLSLLTKGRKVAKKNVVTAGFSESFGQERGNGERFFLSLY